MVDEKKEAGNKNDEDNDQDLDAADNMNAPKAQDDDDSSDDGVS